MRATNYFTRVFRLLKSFNFRNKKEEGNDFINELIHPRFEISENDTLAQKKVPNSLLFLMYSKENEVLFV